MRASREAIDLIKRFEGYRAQAYICPGGKLTIGYGSTDNVREGENITPAQALEALYAKVAEFDAELAQLVQTKLYQHQWDALASFVYNVGPSAFETSRLRRLINLRQFEAVPAEWKKWRWARDKKTGRKYVPPGLPLRRAAEVELWKGKQIDHSRLPDVTSVSSPFAREALVEPPPRVLIPLLPVFNWISKLWR